MKMRSGLLCFASHGALVAAVNPLVNLTYSAYQGKALDNGITQWLGLRYAAAPLGALRFAPPQDPVSTTGVVAADQHGKVCLATLADPTTSGQSEDCLFADVYAPSHATTTSKLPVYVFISGGGFNSISNANYNGSGLIGASGNNIIVVTFNYRVGLFGFLTDGDLVTPNNGIRDQRKVFEWVQKHIAQFGGDPGHVVIGGDSAGAASISLHLVAYGGRNDGLFQGAAAESISFATVLNVSESQYQFDNLATKVNCTKGGQAAVDCLRSRSAAELQAQSGFIPYPYPGVTGSPVYMWNPVVDHDLFDQVTYDAFTQGKFVKVPLIAGDDTNGGASFADPETTTLAESNQFMKNTFPFLTGAQLNKLDALYPNGNETFPGKGAYYRQLSNVYGEGRYMCPGLYISSVASHACHKNSWAYRWNVEDPDQVKSGLGVPHTVEMSALWGPSYVAGPASYAANGTNALASPVIQAYWTSFIRTLNPNTYRYPGSAEWTPWKDRQQNRLLFNNNGATVMESVDAGLQARCKYWAEIGPSIKQ